MAIRLNSLSFAEEVFDQMPHLYIFLVDGERFLRAAVLELTTLAPRSSRSAMMALLSNAFLAISASKASPSISGGNADRVDALSGQRMHHAQRASAAAGLCGAVPGSAFERRR